MRELTRGERDLLLTQEQVNNLPDGAMVIIKWSGGNGPYLYTRTTRYGSPYCPETQHGIDFVGKEKYHTQVFLPTKDTELEDFQKGLLKDAILMNKNLNVKSCL